MLKARSGEFEVVKGAGDAAHPGKVGSRQLRQEKDDVADCEGTLSRPQGTRLLAHLL